VVLLGATVRKMTLYNSCIFFFLLIITITTNAHKTTKNHTCCIKFLRVSAPRLHFQGIQNTKVGYCSIMVCTTLCFGLPEDETCKNYMSFIIFSSFMCLCCYCSYLQQRIFYLRTATCVGLNIPSLSHMIC
jgi:hypothetical protein